MQLSEVISPGAPAAPEREQILGLLTQIQRRQQLNRALHVLALCGGLVLLALIAWRLLRWLGETAPAASALVILAALLGGFAVVSLLAIAMLREGPSARRAARAADLRAALKDELVSAHAFIEDGRASAWVAAQLQRAGRTARGLQPAQIVPLHLPATLLAVLAAGAVILAIAWRAAPRAPTATLSEDARPLDRSERAQVDALRALADTLRDQEAAAKVKKALAALDRPGASQEAQRRALADAQEALEQSRLKTAAALEGLSRIGDRMRSQAGMEGVAEALRRGDAKEAAHLLSQMQPRGSGSEKTQAGNGDAGPAPGAGEKSLDQVMKEATQSKGGPEAAGSAAMKEAIDRLNKIAQELEADSKVTQANQAVQKLQMSVAQRSTLSAGRFAQQNDQDGTPAPETGQADMKGGTMYRSAAVAQGKGGSESQEGSRAGDAQGDAPSDPLLGAHAERLEAQLKRTAIQDGGEAKDEQQKTPWFYAESQQQQAHAQWREVQARGRAAEADAGGNQGISIQHRQIVKDYFMNLREGAQ